MNRNAFTLVEIMVSITFTLMLIAGVYGFFNVNKVVSGAGMAEETLVDGANIVLSRIIEGAVEPGGAVARLTQGVSYCIGSGNSCATVNTAELHFWDLQGKERWFHLNASRTSLLFRHPTTAVPAGTDDVLYTAPSGAKITLIFWTPINVNNPTQNVGVNVALTQTVLGRVVTGAATSLINLRNHL